MTVVETERLVLRPWRRDDLDAVAAVCAEPRVWHYPFGRGLSREESEAFLERQLRHWETHGFGMWAAEKKGEQTLIGVIGLAVPTWLPEILPAVEVGWRLHPDCWGHGLATEGGAASLRYGFENLGLDRIVSIFEPDNVASRRVMEKLGMSECGTASHPTLARPLVVRELTAAGWRRHVNRPKSAPEG